MELDAKRPVAKEEKERDFVGEIRAAVQVDQGCEGSGGENGLKNPGQREGRKQLCRASLLRMKGGLASFESAVRGHQDTDQREQENGVCGAAAVAGRCKGEPANDGDAHAKEDYRRGVIPNLVVETAGFAGEPVRDTHGEDRECAARQDQETGEDQNMNGAREPVPRMPPLRQPKAQNPAQPRQWLVEPEIVLRAQKWRQSPRHDIGKTEESQ